MFKLIPKHEGLLFASSDLSQELDTQAQSLQKEVSRLSPNRLLNTAPADLENYLVEKYTLKAPSLRGDDMTADSHEIEIDVSRDSMRVVHDRNRPCMIAGQKIEVEIPFDGDSELFYARASSSSLNPPRASVKGHTLVISVEIPHDDTSRDLKREIDRTIEGVETHLDYVRSDIEKFNASLPQLAKRTISERREQILRNQGRVASLGIPLKVRDDAPKTYAAPEVRKRILPTPPKASEAPYEPEPALSLDLYEDVLEVIQHMSRVMERSPSAFTTMNEEDLRHHFLVQLNGRYEGQASGETFNYNGKTDILLRVRDRNIFIAECKFWRGPKGFKETIDQLLNYQSWRDTKTAILVFNRDTSLSTVLEKIPATAQAHPNYKRTLDWESQAGFRYVFHHKADPNREFLLTVLVFEVPSRP